MGKSSVHPAPAGLAPSGAPIPSTLPAFAGYGPDVTHSPNAAPMPEEATRVNDVKKPLSPSSLIVYAKVAGANSATNVQPSFEPLLITRLAVYIECHISMNFVVGCG